MTLRGCETWTLTASQVSKRGQIQLVGGELGSHGGPLFCMSAQAASYYEMDTHLCNILMRNPAQVKVSRYVPNKNRYFQ